MKRTNLQPTTDGLSSVESVPLSGDNEKTVIYAGAFYGVQKALTATNILARFLLNGPRRSSGRRQKTCALSIVRAEILPHFSVSGG